MRSMVFESALEKIGRILARQYGLNVVYEGKEAKTDGKTIYLPAVDDLTPEMKKDLNGYLDHEVAHCKFTEFPEIKFVKNKFHQNLLNACEDVRIEREMINEFPGTQFNLHPLREKCLKETYENWEKMPWPIRLIVAIQAEMNGDEVKVDADFKKYWDLVETERAELNNCQDTKSIREITETISEKVKEESGYEEPEEGEGSEGGEEGEKKDGDGEGSGGDSDNSDSDGDSDSDSDGDGDSDSDGGEAGESSADGEGKKKGKPKRKKGKPHELLIEKVGEKENGESEFDKHNTDVGSYVNAQLNDAIEMDSDNLDEGIRRYRYHDYAMSNKKHIATTTRFDKVTDWTGKGSSKNYMALRSEVMPVLGPVKNALERMLKVIENARWTGERERGSLNRKDLAKIATYPAYRTPFKEFTKVETNNVAIELLVDMSGSMGGKVHTAKQAIAAMAESLRGLQIPFEVTGFHAKGDSNMQRFSRSLKDLSRYNRYNEILDHFIFKSFDSNDLSGIEKIFSGGNNVDGESVRWAAKRLAERHEKRKILMVFSDGMPAAHVKDESVLNGDLKKAVEGIKRSGMEVIGFGIETDAVSHFYPEYIVIDDLKDLPSKVMSKLTQIITRGLKAS